MNEKITIVWQIMTLGGVLISVIYVLIDLLVEIIKERNYKKMKGGFKNGR